MRTWRHGRVTVCAYEATPTTGGTAGSPSSENRPNAHANDPHKDELISGGIDDETIRIWLEALLSEGPVDLSVINKQAVELRVSKRSLARVKSTLGIISQKGTYSTHQGKWFWSLPEGDQRVPGVREEEGLPW